MIQLLIVVVLVHILIMQSNVPNVIMVLLSILLVIHVIFVWMCCRIVGNVHLTLRILVSLFANNVIFCLLWSMGNVIYVPLSLETVYIVVPLICWNLFIVLAAYLVIMLIRRLISVCNVHN